MQNRHISPSKRSVLVPLTTFLITAFVMGIIISRLSVQDRKMERVFAKNLIQQIAYNLQSTMSVYFELNQFWKNYIIHNNGEVTHFDSVAESMYGASPSIERIQISPNGVSTYFYPKMSIGDPLDLFSDPLHRNDANFARLTRQTTVTGPFVQRRKGAELAIRTPIYMDGKNGENLFWGFSTISVRISEIFKEAHLPEIQDAGFNYQLKSINTQRGSLDIIDCSTYSTLKNPVSYTFSVHNAAWTLSVEPRTGWTNYTRFLSILLIGFFLTLLISFSIVSFWNYSHRELTFKKVSYVDSLTQLHNNRKFYEVLSELDKKGKDFAILSVNLNKFRQLSETYGRRSIDELLIIASKKLKNCIREGDEVFRISDDVFSILIPNQISINGLSNLMQRIKLSIERPTVLGATTVQVTASIGYARYPQDGTSFETVVQNAEEMMNASKNFERT